MTTVGVIGLGRMGLPISMNLIERGFDVVGYRRTMGPEVAEAGIAPATSPAELAARSDVVLSILPGIDAVREVVLGPAGTLTTLRPGTVHIEMSTLDVADKAAVRDRVREAGGDMLDAPISGSESMVAPRMATTFASGRAESVEKVADVLAAISGPWVPAGEFGQGVHFKYIANHLLAVHTVAAAEALAMARRSGLDLDVVQRTIDESIGGSMVWRRFGPRMRNREWKPARGPIDMLHAILEQIAEHGRKLDVRTPTFDAAKQEFDRAVADGWGELDIISVHDRLVDTDRPEQG